MSAPHIQVTKIPTIGNIPIRSSNDSEEEKLSVLVQGPAKTGKTHFAASFPKPLFIYMDPNEAVLLKFPDIQFIVPKNYTELATAILPAIQNREIKAETIVLDSASFFADRLVSELKGNRPKLDFGGWGLVLDRLGSTIATLVDAARFDPRRPTAQSYNIVVTTHERTDTDEEGRIQKITPAISGQFRESIARYFNTVCLSAYVTADVVLPGQPGTPPGVKKEGRYLLYTIPPDRFRACGDGVGGGKYKVLPPTIPNTYEDLMAAWGRTK